MCFDGGDAPPPPPLDPAAVALEQKQLELLNQQQQQQNAFQALYADQFGYTATNQKQMVDNPNFDSMLANNKTHLEEMNKAITQLSSPSSYNSKTGQSTPSTYTDWSGKTYNKDNVKDLVAQRDSFQKDYVDNPTYKQIQQDVTVYGKTPERVAQEKALSDLQSQQMATAKKANDALNSYLDSLNTDDYREYQKQQTLLQQQQTQIALAQGERTQKALAGQLPLSQGTIDRKAQDFQLLKENLAKSGNAIIGDDPSSAYSLSSPGSQALKEFNSRYAAVEDQERMGALDSGTQAYLQAVGLSGNIGNTALSASSGLSNPGGYASTSNSFMKGASPVSNNLGLVQGYGAAMNPYLQQQELQTKVGMANAGIDAQNTAGWMNLAGTAIGSGAGLALLKSSKSFKKNIEEDSPDLRGLYETKLYKWNYKDEHDGSKKHLGVLTEEAPEAVVAEDGKHIDVASYLGLLTKSAQHLNSRVMSLEGK